MAEHGLWRPPAGETAAQADEEAVAASGPFRALDCESIKHYVAARPALQQRVGLADSVDSWTVKEVRRGGVRARGAVCVLEEVSRDRMSPDLSAEKT